MRGVIAAGGTGSRMGPLTFAVNKHLLPVHDKPMIFYALSTLMAAGIRSIAIVTTSDQISQFERTLGDGTDIGIELTYLSQAGPAGVADVLHVARGYLCDESFGFILGDNFFYGPGLGRRLTEVRPHEGGHVFAARVSNPEDYGVVSWDVNGELADIQEKPDHPQSSYAVPGLYFYAGDVWSTLETLRPSQRGELEISDLNQSLLRQGRLSVEILPRGTVWLDAGTVSALAKASEFVAVLQARQGQLIGSPEEVAFVNGWISAREIQSRSRRLGGSAYGEYLNVLAQF